MRNAKQHIVHRCDDPPVDVANGRQEGQPVDPPKRMIGDIDGSPVFFVRWED